MRRLKYHPSIIRLSSWEYWPMYITVIPVVSFWLAQSLKMRDLAFFTAINPSIYMGGMYGTSKWHINSLLPAELLPRTIFLPAGNRSIEAVMHQMQQNDLSFPVILKPDVGERGFNVFKVTSKSQLKSLIERIDTDLLLQEYVYYPLEMSILCYQIPGSDEMGITSVCKKEFLSVRGDGRLSLAELMQENPRAVLQLERLRPNLDLELVPADGEVIELEPIGNHARGTRFLNINNLKDSGLADIFLPILQRMEGVHFGRFDIRAESVDTLLAGEAFKILEFNGVNSEPVHVYDPSHGAIRAYRDYWHQWSLMGRIAMRQKSLGVKSQTATDAWKALLTHFRNRKTEAQISLS